MVKRVAAVLCLSTLMPVLVVVGASVRQRRCRRWPGAGSPSASRCRVLSAGVAVAYLVRRYQPAVAALRGGFQDLAATGFAEVPAARAR